MPVEEYRKLFREKYLSMKLPTNSIDPGNPYEIKRDNVEKMSLYARMNARKTIDIWSRKNYPETRDENVKILDDYLTLCEQNNIRPIMFMPPMTEGYMKHFSKQKLDEFHCLVNQACQKHAHAVFIDGWDFLNLPDTDFFDVDHMNFHGAADFSVFLNDFIDFIEAQKL